MKEETVLTSRIDELRDYSWLTFTSKDGVDIVFVNNKESVEEAAKLWGITPAAVKAINDAFDFMTESFIYHIKKDLVDIWKASKQ